MGKLYIVPTPVGNLGDMTYRAVEVLKQVDFVLAEDTRTSGNLLRHFGVGKYLGRTKPGQEGKGRMAGCGNHRAD